MPLYPGRLLKQQEHSIRTQRRQSRNLGRQGSGKLVIGQAQVKNGGQVSNGRRNRPRQLIGVQSQVEQAGVAPKTGWYRPRQCIVLQLESFELQVGEIGKRTNHVVFVQEYRF